MRGACCNKQERVYLLPETCWPLQVVYAVLDVLRVSHTTFGNRFPIPIIAVTSIRAGITTKRILCGIA